MVSASHRVVLQTVHSTGLQTRLNLIIIVLPSQGLKKHRFHVASIRGFHALTRMPGVRVENRSR